MKNYKGAKLTADWIEFTLKSGNLGDCLETGADAVMVDRFIYLKIKAKMLKLEAQSELIKEDWLANNLWCRLVPVSMDLPDWLAQDIKVEYGSNKYNESFATGAQSLESIGDSFNFKWLANDFDGTFAISNPREIGVYRSQTNYAMLKAYADYRFEDVKKLVAEHNEKLCKQKVGKDSKNVSSNKNKNVSKNKQKKRKYKDSQIDDHDDDDSHSAHSNLDIRPNKQRQKEKVKPSTKTHHMITRRQSSIGNYFATSTQDNDSSVDDSDADNFGKSGSTTESENIGINEDDDTKMSNLETKSTSTGNLSHTDRQSQSDGSDSKSNSSRSTSRSVSKSRSVSRSRSRSRTPSESRSRSRSRSASNASDDIDITTTNKAKSGKTTQSGDGNTQVSDEESEVDRSSVSNESQSEGEDVASEDEWKPSSESGDSDKGSAGNVKVRDIPPTIEFEQKDIHPDAKRKTYSHTKGHVTVLHKELYHGLGAVNITANVQIGDINGRLVLRDNYTTRCCFYLMFPRSKKFQFGIKKVQNAGHWVQFGGTFRRKYYNYYPPPFSKNETPY